MKIDKRKMKMDGSDTPIWRAKDGNGRQEREETMTSYTHSFDTKTVWFKDKDERARKPTHSIEKNRKWIELPIYE